jgi:hypothetical protein
MHKKQLNYRSNNNIKNKHRFTYLNSYVLTACLQQFAMILIVNCVTFILFALYFQPKISDMSE